MKIKLQQVKIRDIVKDYTDNSEEGCFAYGGKLNIRPIYQREYVYTGSKREEVIKTIQKNLPLNMMYWIKNGDNYEVLDGQQRTISFCQYFKDQFALDNIYFSNLTPEEQNEMLDYEIGIYICEGSEREKLDWFKIINIAGVELTPQELKNAIFTGKWLSDAKRHFSKNYCPAYEIGHDYVKGAPIRQELLETALKWISEDNIEGYMSKHQKDEDANELWTYFQEVIEWVKRTFPKYRSIMKGLGWGYFYNKFKDFKYNSNNLETRIVDLLGDEEVTSNKGIYEYLLSGETKSNKLSLRTFDDKIKRQVSGKQEGICTLCLNKFNYEDMQGDHILPWSKGGNTTKDNCQMLCKKCNGTKSNK